MLLLTELGNLLDQCNLFYQGSISRFDLNVASKITGCHTLDLEVVIMLPRHLASVTCPLLVNSNLSGCKAMLQDLECVSGLQTWRIQVKHVCILCLCRHTEAATMLEDALKLAGALQNCELDADSYSDLCKVSVWFARRSKDRHDVQSAQQVLSSLETMLAIRTMPNPMAVMYHQPSSLQVCGGAVAGAVVMALCSRWQVVFLFTCLACVLARLLTYSFSR